MNFISSVCGHDGWQDTRNKLNMNKGLKDELNKNAGERAARKGAARRQKIREDQTYKVT